MAAVHSLSVLVVEDQPDVADTLRIYLELCCDFRVSIAGDGEAAVRAAVAGSPGAVVCDIGLPRMDGFQVAREVAATLSPKPLLIAVTGYGGPENEARALAAGFDHFLVKPADPCRIEALLKTHAHAWAN